MTQTTPAAEEDAAKRDLRRDFPGWSIIHTRDTGRWWATRNPVPRRPGEPRSIRQVSEVDADTAELLREKLAEVVS